MMRKITYSNIAKLVFLLLILSTVVMVRLNGEAAVTTDEALLDGRFGVGYGPNEDGSIPLGNDLTYTVIAIQEDGKVVVAGRIFSTVSRLTRFEEDGSLDLGFGTQGEVILSGGINDMAIQPDGKIVVSGSKEDNFMVARFLTNGLPDTSFSGDGVASIDFDGGFDSARRVIIQSDGKILLGGDASDCRLIGSCGHNDDLALARFNPDGSIDNSFDSDGKVAFSLGSDNEYITSLKIDINGDIIAAGKTEQGDDSVVILVRISEDGSFLNSFDGDGRLITENRAFEGTNHLILPDGKIVFPVLDDRGVARRVTLTRLSPDGEPDLSFGEDGYVVAPAGFTTHSLSNPLLLPPFPNGDFLYIGDSSSQGDVVLALLKPDGTVRESFGEGGLITHDFGTDETVIDASIDELGRIILLHTADGAYKVTRFLPSGRIDGGGGHVYQNPLNGRDEYHDVLVQPNGRVLAVGETGEKGKSPHMMLSALKVNGRPDDTFEFSRTNPLTDLPGIARTATLDRYGNILIAAQASDPEKASGWDFLLMRFDANGNTFNFRGVGDQGWPLTTITNSSDVPQVIAVQPDEKIVVGGYANTETSIDFALVRYLPDGTLDPTFSGGMVITDIKGEQKVDKITDLTILPDGKILVLGTQQETVVSESFSVLVRYLPDGRLDSSFGANGVQSVRPSTRLITRPDGKIVVGGTINVDGKLMFNVARYLSNGLIDNTFASSGGQITIEFDGSTGMSDMLMEPDGSLVLAGCQYGEPSQFAMARVRPEGSLDPSFSADGRAVFSVDTVRKACANALAIDQEGKGYILAGGTEADLADMQLTLLKVKRLKGENNPPLAGEENYSVAAGTTLDVAAPGVLANDHDPDGDMLTITVYAYPENGEFSFNADGSFTYTPFNGFVGVDAFGYTVWDGNRRNDVGIVHIEVIGDPVNNPPLVREDNISLAQDTPFSLPAPGVLANDEDADGNELTAVLHTPPAHGTVSLAADGSLTYTPDSGFVGFDAFIYQADDGSELSEPVTVEVAVIAQGENVAPVALDDHYTVLQDTQLSVAAPGILQNDMDADGDSLKPLLISYPRGGELVLNENGSFIYTPKPGFIGKDRFAYQAEDEETLPSFMATVIIEVVPAAGNTAPTAVPNSYTASQDKALSVAAPGVLDNDIDAEGNPLTAVLETPPSNGTVTLNRNGSFTYVGNSSFVGSDAFTYRATDGQKSSNPVTVTIEVVAAGTNARPTAVGDNYTVKQDTLLTITVPGVLDNDSDADGEPLTAVLETTTNNGSLTLNVDGSFTYQPNEGFVGPDSFTYRAHDSQDSSEPATVTFTVLADKPTPPTGQQIYLPLIMTNK